MKKDHVRISIDVSKDLNERLRKAAEEKDMTLNAFIRLAIENYLKSLD